MWDLNNVMHVNEKLGPRPVNITRMSNFCHLVKECGFMDLGLMLIPLLSAWIDV